MSGQTVGAAPGIAIWGGFECTVVRVGDGYRDQLAETGHRTRIEDLDAVAALGIRTLRYPILWETIAHAEDAEAAWAWHDARLERLRALGIRPIVGLVHHGSGPRHTHLLDPGFPAGLAAHAAAVARRYPWVDLYIPVNEPLTTARFSALYGHWYPHARDLGSFLRALVTECRATAEAMAAIRAVNPAAQLVQTEDLGKVFSTPELAYQAEFENGRRWLSFDLLCGWVTPENGWWSFCVERGVADTDLAALAERPCPPDILGINHYLTSDRFLDQNLDRHPPESHGGNAFQRYADIAAVRAPEVPASEIGLLPRLREVWERYRRPIAVTEVHNGCTRDEQLRWLRDAWDAAVTLKAEGADIRALTVWALLGAVDWNSLLTRVAGHYETGVFDARPPVPRPTALATAVAALARGEKLTHPVLDREGWWRGHAPRVGGPARPGLRRPRRLLFTRSPGLDSLAQRIAAGRGLDAVLAEAPGTMSELAALLERERPWAVLALPLGGDKALQDDGEAVRRTRLAEACAARAIPFVSFSSDRVFDGRLGRAYVESDPVCPGCAVGARAARAEADIFAAHDGALVVRTGLLFGWEADNDPVLGTLRRLARGRPIHVPRSRTGSLTAAPDLLHAALDLLIDAAGGLWHLAHEDTLSGPELNRLVAKLAGHDERLVRERPDAETTLVALGSERGGPLPALEPALARHVGDLVGGHGRTLAA